MSSSSTSTSKSTSLFPSQQIHDRSSIFLAIYSPALPPQAISTLPTVTGATHRITAWRRPSPQKTLQLSSSHSASGTGPRPPTNLFSTGHDDDGEAGAGIRAEKVLISEDVQGSVVVGRWYGGVMLGPVRFVHIENVVREAVGLWKAGREREEREKGEKEEKERLVRVLGERDGSIDVLRGLLAEKMSEGEGGDGSKEVGGLGTPETEKVVKKRVDYSNMELATLKRLEKARDATIKWVLKQIDDVEARQRTNKRKASVEHGDEDTETGTAKKVKTDGDGAAETGD